MLETAISAHFHFSSLHIWEHRPCRNHWADPSEHKAFPLWQGCGVIEVYSRLGIRFTYGIQASPGGHKAAAKISAQRPPQLWTFCSWQFHEPHLTCGWGKLPSRDSACFRERLCTLLSKAADTVQFFNKRHNYCSTSAGICVSAQCSILNQNINTMAFHSHFSCVRLKDPRLLLCTKVVVVAKLQSGKTSKFSLYTAGLVDIQSAC